MPDDYTAKRERIIAGILSVIFPAGRRGRRFNEESLRPFISDAVHQGAFLVSVELEAAQQKLRDGDQNKILPGRPGLSAHIT